MRINSIKIGCRSEMTSGDIGTDSLLIYFRSPVVFLSGGRERRISGNSAVLITGSYKQSFRASEGQPLRYDCISFRMSSADKQYLSSLDISVDEPVELSDDYVIAGMIKCMKAQFMKRSRNSAEFMELSMRLLFITVSEANDSYEHKAEKAVPRYGELKKLREAIYDEPMGEWNSDVLAAEMGISRAYFHRIYLSAFGVTCRQDVIESRLLYAADLLRTTDLSVSAVAERCGYESDSYFMRQFRQHKGCTPTEYRNSSADE